MFGPAVCIGQNASFDNAINTLVEQRHRRSPLNEIGQWPNHLLSQAGLEWRQDGKELDDFNGHPVVPSVNQ